MRVFKRIIILCLLLSLFILHFSFFVTNFSLNRKTLQDDLNSVGKIFSITTNKYLSSLKALTADNNVTAALLNRKKDPLEIKLDKISDIVKDIELVLISDLSGNIIATNRKNSSVKSFDNSSLLKLDVKAFKWYEKYKANMPKKIDNLTIIKGGLPSLMISSNADKYYLEVVTAIFDVAGSRIGVITSYINMSSIEEILYKNKANILLSDGELIGYGKRYKPGLSFDFLNLVYTIKRDIEINDSMGLSKSFILNILGASVLESILIIVLIIFWISLYFYIKNLLLQTYSNFKINDEEYKRLADLESQVINSGIIADKRGIRLSKNSRLIEKAILPLEEEIIEKNITIKELQTTVDKYKNIEDKYKYLSSMLNSFKKQVSEQSNYLNKILIKNKPPASNNNKNQEEITDDSQIDITSLIKKKELIFSALRDLSEEVLMTLQTVYPIYLANIDKTLNTAFESVKRRLKYLLLNIGAIEGFFQEVNLDKFSNLYYENSELKKENNRLKILSDKLVEATASKDLYKKALVNITNSLKEIEQSASNNPDI